MATALILACVAALLAIGVAAIILARSKVATPLVYGAACAVSAVALVVALRQVVTAPAESAAVILPLGLPWLGAHFRIDALSAVFLLAVNLAACLASVFGWAMRATTMSRAGCCRSSRSSSPA